MDNILKIDELKEKSLMMLPARDLVDEDEPDEHFAGSIEMKLADLDREQFTHFASKFMNFANNEGAVLISDFEIFSITQEISIDFKSNFEENLNQCVKQCWGKNKQC